MEGQQPAITQADVQQLSCQGWRGVKRPQAPALPERTAIAAAKPIQASCGIPDVEAIASGNARLVGTSTERIVTEARRLLDDPVERAAMSRRALPFGDGRAGPRIAAIVDEWLERRGVRAAASARISPGHPARW